MSNCHYKGVSIISSSQTSSHHSRIQPNPPRRTIHSQTTREANTKPSDTLPPMFPTSHANKFFIVVAAKTVVPKRMIVWGDLHMTDVILSQDLIEMYKLHHVNSPPSTFNISMVQEFYANVSSKLPNFGGVPCNPDDLCPRSTKDLDKGLMNLSDVMCVVAHVVSQPQFVPSSPSYFTATSSAHSRDVAAKMAATYTAKGKWVASPKTLNISSLHIPMAKHIMFTYSDDEKDEAEEDLEENPEEDPVE
ncbi:hypothetical protein DVH24_013364 [Malus domestica]|uniref:Uncharacterized protein n=1 Tax=Malus domestica TaxID=3750 RepID=A0A498HGM3_MALDO|nr:hypothetical protein DVH24_013364 [Malus domestica]